MSTSTGGRLIHTCYRITDPERSVAFYEALGFSEVGRMKICSPKAPWRIQDKV